MQPHEQLYYARIVASVAATAISLACGTNYVYSAWAPQFAERLRLSSTESNLIGLFGNLGMYTLGVPVGMFVDHRGPRPAVLAGSILLALGYFPLHVAYQNGEGSVPAMCFFSYLSGLGGCMAFAASVKTSALNWPHHRGTATAFPLAAFGLSAFFFSVLGAIFTDSPSSFLVLLAAGTCGITFVGFFFLKVYPHQTYHPVGHTRSHSMSDSQQLRRTSTSEGKPSRGARSQHDIEPGTSSSAPTTTTEPSPRALESAALAEVPSGTFNEGRRSTSSSSTEEDVDVAAVDETSSLISSVGEAAEEILAGSTHIDVDRSHRVDIRGIALLKNVEFWQLWSIMGILAGVGLMTINNIGNDAKALWEFLDPTVTEEFLVQRQQMHVSILSIGSFLGRLASGVGSDFLVKRLHASRVWCLVLACFIFLIAQVCALMITNPHLLGFVSALSGLGYGFLFGVFPSIVAETFGIKGLSQNWGFMTLSPVVSSNVFNLFYGTTYDSRSVKREGGERVCMDGLACYQAAYVMTLAACVGGVFVILWTIRHQHAEQLKEQRKAEQED